MVLRVKGLDKGNLYIFDDDETSKRVALAGRRLVRGAYKTTDDRRKINRRHGKLRTHPHRQMENGKAFLGPLLPSILFFFFWLLLSFRASRLTIHTISISSCLISAGQLGHFGYWPSFSNSAPLFLSRPSVTQGYDRRQNVRNILND